MKKYLFVILIIFIITGCKNVVKDSIPIEEAIEGLAKEINNDQVIKGKYELGKILEGKSLTASCPAFFSISEVSVKEVTIQYKGSDKPVEIKDDNGCSDFVNILGNQYENNSIKYKIGDEFQINGIIDQENYDPTDPYNNVIITLTYYGNKYENKTP
ncbi:hypothetical protein [Falsibacillus pallidus]|uniref:Lipoprotein n=1 Tax=Falsibacillus pallidus TaxID=493781 RepID=A0A370GH03_9BACI|nr:hypothetical protein [Falsibacillus pallidus]RDI41664.1 hypothetical protein DFR59_107119 [Falsibacillus pallidus]